MTANLKTRIAIAITVTAGIFYISASHITHIAMEYGNPMRTAVVFPLAIDGVILFCTLTLTTKTGINKATRSYCNAGRWFGFAATVYANMAASGWDSTDGVIINLIPAVALILMLEALIHTYKGTPASKRAAKK